MEAFGNLQTQCRNLVHCGLYSERMDSMLDELAKIPEDDFYYIKYTNSIVLLLV